MNFARHAREGSNRPAITELVGALLAISITIIAGAAAWSFVRGQAGASELALQNSAVSTNNYLNEKFAIVTLNFPAAGGCTGSSTANCVQLWIFNSGSILFQPLSVRVYDSAGTINILYSYSGTSNYAYDLASSLTGQCQTSATTLESTTLTTLSIKQTNLQYLTLTIPASATGCPSYGVTALTSGDTYTVTLTGLYGNIVTSSQVHP